MERNKSIDGLRGITMLLLVVFHLFYSYLENFEGREISFLLINRWGVIGYTIFLVISGYYIEKSSKTGVEFISKKILRLWPTYFFGITVLYVVSFFLPLPNKTVSLGAYILNVFYINHLLGAAYVDTAHWYLSTLVWCSVVFSLIKIIQTKIKSEDNSKSKNEESPNTLYSKKETNGQPSNASKADAKRNMGILGGYLYFAYIFALLLFFTLAKYTSIRLFSVMFNIIGGNYATLLLWGVILSYALDKGQKLTTAVLIGANLIATVLILDVKYLAVVAFAATIVGVLSKYNFRFMQNKVFLWLGEVSYSTYVVHAYMGFTLIYYISHFVGGYQYYISGIVVVLMILYGWLTYIFVEKPSAILIQKLAGKNR